MTVRLRDEDRRAVDLLLDRAASGAVVSPTDAGNGNGNGHGHAASAFSPVSGDMQVRVSGVQNVLQVLEMLPADEPPQDLLGRTLQRLETDMANHPSALRAPQPAPGAEMHQPHA